MYIKEGDATCGILFFRRLAYTCRQTCVRNSRGFVPSDRSSHSPLGERDFGREVGTLFYIWDEGTKAYYPYRMVDYCSLLWLPRNGQVYPFFVLLVSGYILPPSLCGLASLGFPEVGITVTCFPNFSLMCSRLLAVTGTDSSFLPVPYALMFLPSVIDRTLLGTVLSLAVSVASTSEPHFLACSASFLYYLLPTASPVGCFRHFPCWWLAPCRSLFVCLPDVSPLVLSIYFKSPSDSRFSCAKVVQATFGKGTLRFPSENLQRILGQACLFPNSLRADFDYIYP